ncbi:Hypothetical predicted protein [Cloeon dipterum]|uniref:F-box domain-containing protein n=1 Tax=Cloeon dipterum TaxID=197152 RepID=A0A8S1CE80_9INSE|nr:Hypothetical predicted protein [Cloeon dipterum]
MESLPFEMLEHIFNFMDNQELCKIQPVCHTWKAVIDGIIIRRFLKTSPRQRSGFNELEISDRVVVAKHFARNLLKNCNFEVSYELNEEIQVLIPGRYYFIQVVLHWETPGINRSMYSTRFPRADSIPKHFVRAHGIGNHELKYMKATSTGDVQSQTIHLKDLNITEEFMDRIQPTVYFEEWIGTYPILYYSMKCCVRVEIFDDNDKLLASKCISLTFQPGGFAVFRRVRSSLKGYGKGARMIRFSHWCKLNCTNYRIHQIDFATVRSCKFALPRVTFALEDFKQTLPTKRSRLLKCFHCLICRGKGGRNGT